MIQRGFHLTSICSNSFFTCSYACTIWNWLQQMIDYSSHIICLEDCYLLMNRTASPQCNLVSIVVVASTVQIIWFARNQIRFRNVLIPWKSSCSSIVSMTLMARNSCKGSTSSSMKDFVILKNFSITIHPHIPSV